MRRNHSFSKRNKAKKKSVGVEVGGERSWAKFQKRGRLVNIGGYLREIEGFGTLC